MVSFSCSPSSIDRIYNIKMCSISKSMKHQHKLEGKLELPLLSYGYQECMCIDPFSGWPQSVRAPVVSIVESAK